MSNTRFLEINSTYRDRNLWPLAGNFEVPISVSGQKGKDTALDPVSTAMPEVVWTSNRVDANTSGTSVSVDIVSTAAGTNNIGSTTDPYDIIITSASGNLQQAENYYRKLVFENTALSVKRRITGYKYLGIDSSGNDRAVIVLDSPLPDTFVGANPWSISDPTDVSDTSFPLFFVPMGNLGANSYANHYLYNESLNEYRIIEGYQADTHILTTVGNPVTGWLITHNYNIRENIPFATGALVAPVTSTNEVTLAATASGVNDIYKGDFIRLTVGSGTYPSASSYINEARKIITYNGTTKVATVYPPFSSLPAVGTTYELLPFSYDNFCPFNYSGSTVSQQEAVCYEIELLDLVLPNFTLDCGEGSRIAFYPYVYVELSNISGPSAGNVNIIYSNNPNATRMLFRAAIDDVQNPLTSSFIKVDGDGAVQVIKFKPNDNLRFSVRLPSGEIYKTIIPENTSPSKPNPLGQISAWFSIKRL